MLSAFSPSVSASAAPPSSDLRQLRLLLHRQRPPLRQRLQHHNPISSSLSRLLILRALFLLLLQLRHLRLELRQLRLLLHRQRPPLRQRLQLHNTGGSSLLAWYRSASLSSVSATAAPSAGAPPTPPPAPPSAAPAPPTPPTRQHDRQQPFPPCDTSARLSFSFRFRSALGSCGAACSVGGAPLPPSPGLPETAPAPAAASTFRRLTPQNPPNLPRELPALAPAFPATGPDTPPRRFGPVTTVGNPDPQPLPDAAARNHWPATPPPQPLPPPTPESPTPRPHARTSAASASSPFCASSRSTPTPSPARTAAITCALPSARW